MKSPTEALEHASVRQYCKAVRVPAIAANSLAASRREIVLDNGFLSVGVEPYAEVQQCNV